MRKRALARELGSLSGFEEPQVEHEQYRTPGDIAAQVVGVARLQGDIEDRPVVDLGCGTGILGLGAALAGAREVVGVDVDAAALHTAQVNETQVDPPCPVAWVQGDAGRVPLCPDEPLTVLTNPPFGAQDGNEHADRAFLATASEVAAVSYSVHNEGSQSFVESFAADNGGQVTHAFRATLDLPAVYEFHTDERRRIETEVYRIEW